jgi:hypothetical protein
MLDPIRLEMPLAEEGDQTSKITGLYTPMMLSTELANHQYVYCAVSSGNIYILNI